MLVADSITGNIETYIEGSCRISCILLVALNMIGEPIMATQKQGFLLRFAPGIVLCLIGAFLMLFGILPVPARITIFVVGLVLMATLAVPWIVRKSREQT